MEASKLRTGMKIMQNNEPWVIVNYTLRPQSRGSAKMIAKMKNLISWQIVEKTFPSSENLEDADISNGRAQYLYKDQDNYIFMDNETYEQFEFNWDKLWTQVNFLVDDMQVGVLKWNWNVINVELPPTINVKISETWPWLKWDTVSWWTKPATLETWAIIQVPLFINTDEEVVVNTQTWEYKERVKH